MMDLVSRDLRTRTAALSTDQRGTTLIELLVGMAVGAIFMGGAMTVLILGFHDQSAVDDRSQSASAANIALERLSTDIRNVAVSCTTGEGLSGGVTVTVNATYRSIEFCEANPSAALSSASTTTAPVTQVVEWYCSTPSTGYGSCRRYTASTASGISTTASAPTTIYGVAAVSLAGVLQTSTGGTAAPSSLSSSATYPLVPTSTSTALSWLGVTLTLAQLADPGTTITTTVPNTQAVQFQAGGELRNFQL